MATDKTQTGASDTNEPIAHPAAGDVAPSLFESTSMEHHVDIPHRNKSSRSLHDRDRMVHSESSDPDLGSQETSTVTTAVDTTPTDDDRIRSEDHDVHAEGHGLEEGGLRFPPAMRTTTSASGKPYSSFSNGMKWCIVTLAGVAAVFSPIR
jgi:hypothetical protein